jgi:hypothetical protein
MWYDNNCHVKKVLKRYPEDPLNKVALPVDVFHFKSKHKESDEFCGSHCNPILWDELTVNGKWRFNSSAAEQMNAWICGYQAIVQNMRAVRATFFLDEMIRRRNEWMVMELSRKGKNPRNIKRSVLLGES